MLCIWTVDELAASDPRCEFACGDYSLLAHSLDAALPWLRLAADGVPAREVLAKFSSHIAEHVGPFDYPFDDLPEIALGLVEAVMDLYLEPSSVAAGT